MPIKDIPKHLMPLHKRKILERRTSDIKTSYIRTPREYKVNFTLKGTRMNGDLNLTKENIISLIKGNLSQLPGFCGSYNSNTKASNIIVEII